jgi:hypothetical protein
MADSLASGDCASYRERDRHYIRPALVVREDHFGEQDSDRGADDCSENGPDDAS